MAQPKQRRLPVCFEPPFRCECEICTAARAAKAPPAPQPPPPDLETRVCFLEAWVLLARVSNPRLPDLIG